MKIPNLCLGIAWLLGSYSAAAAVADRFDYPIGNRDRYTEANDGDGWYVAQEFGEWNSDFSKYHLGEDWNAESGGNTDCGLPVYAVANGTIVYANIATGWGRVLIVRHTLPDGSQVESLYGHLASFAKTSGDVVRGDQIGTIGDGSEGGTTYSCHLHLEIRTAVCPNWGQAGPGYSTTPMPVGWTDPSDYIDSRRQLFGLNDGLVAYYPFNGNANDASGNGNAGVVNGATLTVDRFGSPASAYDFNGSSSYIGIPQTSQLNLLTSSFTLSAWIYQRTAIPDGYRILDKCPDGLPTGWTFDTYGCYTYGSGRRLRLQATANNSCNVVGGTDYSLQRWHHVVATVSGTDGKVYLDGVLDGTGNVGNIPANALDVYVGHAHPRNGSGNLEWFNGIIDDVRIYNRALSSSEVLQLHNAEYGSSGPLIVTQPAGQSCQAGADVALTATASGTPPLHYQWRFNGQEIAGATSAALTLTSVTAANSGGYSVTVWNAYGSAPSTVASLAVLADGANGNAPTKTSGPPGPTKLPGKNNLVFVTHGCRPGPQVPPPSQWVSDMCNDIQSRVPSDWQVFPYFWTDDAWAYKDPLHLVELAMLEAKVMPNAKSLGVQLGTQIAAQGWQHVHFIGHSAGAALIQTAADTLQTLPSPPEVHTTFLDPYSDPLDYAGGHYGRSWYGQNADWADCYYALDQETRVFTDGPLSHAYNVDVTWVDPSKTLATIYCYTPSTPDSTPTASLPCGQQATSTHEWPHYFYSNSIVATLPTCAAGYGFPLSKEGGGWANRGNYSAGNEPLPLCGPAPMGQNPFTLTTGQPLSLDGLPHAASASGLNIFGGGFTMSGGLWQPLQQPDTKGGVNRNDGPQPEDATDGVVWLAVGLTVTNAVNFVAFDAGFTGTNGGQGLLTVYWNTNKIGMVDERVALSSVQTYRFTLPGTVTNGIYTLGFRLDTFTNITSSITVTNVATGFVGTTQPISLDMLLMGSNNTPVLKLTAAPGYNYLVQSSTNLVDWLPTALFVNTNGTVLFADPAATSGSARFYRAMMP